MGSAIQRSFAGGEVAPELYGRGDQTKYRTGAKLVRNFMVQRYGGATNRPGFRHLLEVPAPVRLVPFNFGLGQVYLAMFGPEVITWLHSGAALSLPANPAAWSNATTYKPGQSVRHSGANYIATIGSLNEAPAVPSAFWHQLDGLTLSLPTDYQADELTDINWTQSADVLTTVHMDHPPSELRRLGHTEWAFSLSDVAPTIEAPTDLAGSGTAGTATIRYAVTALSEDSLEESLPATQDSAVAQRTITAITKELYPVVTTSAAHGLVTGMSVLIDDVLGTFQVNGKTFKITVVDSTKFRIQNPGGIRKVRVRSGIRINSQSHTTVTSGGGEEWGTYVSGGTMTPLGAGTALVTPPATGSPITLTWDEVDGARAYNVYREEHGIYGFIGQATATTFIDDGITPDLLTTPPEARNPFPAPEYYPATVAWFQQRIVFGGSYAEPDRVRTSAVGSRTNFSTRFPSQDDDSVGFRVAATEVNAVRHLVELGKLLILTSGGEFVAAGNEAGSITPRSINLRRQSHNGSSTVRPIVVGNSCLYVQARGSVVRDLTFSLEADVYQGTDLTIFAPHLFDGHQVTAWAWQQVPHSVVWCVRDDGILLGLTYVREHQVWAWHRHDTAHGKVLDIAVLPEGDQDVVYVLTERIIAGVTRYAVERMEQRLVTDARDGFFVDAGLTYDGRNSDPAATLTLSGGTTWLAGEELTMTAAGGALTGFTVGNEAQLVVDGETVRVLVAELLTATTARVEAQIPVPASHRGVAISQWARAVSTLSGLDHLDGATVSILADGQVEPQDIVDSGEVVLQHPAAVVHVGLPIVADLETLDLEPADEQTMIDRKKVVQRCILLVQDSRSIWVGPDADHLTESKARSDEDYEDPVRPVTGRLEVTMRAAWADQARVFIRHRDPLPMTVLAVARAGKIGG